MVPKSLQLSPFFGLEIAQIPREQQDIRELRE
jgi:hypothetical protein